MRQDQKLRCIPFNKKGQIFSVATPNMKIFDQQSQKDNYINSIQKQYIYIVENSDYF